MIESKSGLTAADLAKLVASGIPATLAEQAQLRRVDSQEGGAIIGRKGCGDYAGMVFPYMWPGESTPREYRLRRDRPDLEYKDGEPRERAKYLTAPGLLISVPTAPNFHRKGKTLSFSCEKFADGRQDDAGIRHDPAVIRRGGLEISRVFPKRWRRAPIL